MRTLKVQICAALCLCAGGAMAQEMYPGESVTVNPSSIGGRVLLYPGGEYMRVQRDLLMPGQRSTNGPIQLHPPGTRPAPVRSAAPPAPTRATEARAAEAPVTPRPAPQQARPQQAPAPVAAQPAPQQQVARAQSAAPRPQAPAANSGMTAGWTQTGFIEFLPDQSEVETSRIDAIRFVAGSLRNALAETPTLKVEVMAYGGTPGDKGSDARRLSLQRALSVRQILIDSGIAQDRITVHAMGGVEDGGPADRVDIFTHK